MCEDLSYSTFYRFNLPNKQPNWQIKYRTLRTGSELRGSVLTTSFKNEIVAVDYPDASNLTVVDIYNGTDPTFGTALIEHFTTGMTHTGNSYAVAISSHGRYVAMKTIAGYLVLEVRTRKVRHFDYRGMVIMSVTDEGDLWVNHYIGSHEYSFAIWDHLINSYVFKYAYITEPMVIERNVINDHRNLMAIFTTSNAGNPFSVVIQLFSIKNPVQIKWTYTEVVKAHGGSSLAMAFTEDGKYLAATYSTTTGGKLILFNTELAHPIYTQDFPEPIESVDIVEEGSSVYVAVGAIPSLYLFSFNNQ